MNTSQQHYSTRTTDKVAILIVICLLAAWGTYRAFHRLFPPAPIAIEEENPPVEEVTPPPTKLVVEPPPLAPGDDGTEAKLRDVSWTAYGGEHIAYINRLYAYSLGYDIGSTISMPPRREQTTLTNTADGKKSAIMLLVSEDLSDPERLHVRQLFYDGYALAVGTRMHMQASNTCNSNGCYLELVEN
jgi:hypothetical protein